MSYVIGRDGRRRCIDPCCATLYMNSAEQRAERQREIEVQNSLAHAVKFMIALSKEGRAG